MLVHLKVLTLNCWKKGEVLTAIMESGVELGADLVLVQEAPVFQGWCHPGFDFVWSPGGRVMTGVRRDTGWRVRPRPDLAQAAAGDVQVFDVSRRGHRQLRVVNVYDAPLRSEGMRPAREVDWSSVVTPGTVLAGDFNAHGLRWNPACDAPLHHQFLEELMDRHDLRYVGDG
jgi:hypothetical protein